MTNVFRSTDASVVKDGRNEMAESKDKLISANSILRKLNDRLDNYEDLPPMTVGDFIRLINDEPGVTDEAQNDTV